MSREELKAKIPHGYSKVIAEKAGVTKLTVSNFLNNRSDNLMVELAALEVIADFEEKKRNLLVRING